MSLKEEAGKVKLGALAELLQRSGISLEDVSRVEKVSVWEGFLKDKDGEAQKVDLHGVQLVPAWAEGPQWPVVQPAAPTKVKPLARTKNLEDGQNLFKVVAILPDPQIGFRRYEDGSLDPFHDEAAMAVALRIIRYVQPDHIVNLGDTLDFPEWSSKFLVSPEFVLTTQPTLDRAHLWLAEQKANAPEGTRISLLPGNHDDRLGIAIAKNAMAALRLRPAATPPDHWPVLSLPFLLRLDELGVELAGGYPAGKVEIAPGGGTQPPLYAIHGQKLDVVKVAKTERQSYVQGHIHRIADHHETFELNGQAVTVNAFSPGCLCRIDGAVPSTKSGTDDFGRPVKRIEAWQQGVSVVTVLPDGSWAKEIVSIHDGRAVFRGQVFDGRS